MMREHYFLPPDAGGRQWCKWCGAKFHVQMDATCLERPGQSGSGMMPEPQRRIPACEDDSIAARIAELRKLREEAWNTADEPSPPAPDPIYGDCCG